MLIHIVRWVSLPAKCVAQAILWVHFWVAFLILLLIRRGGCDFGTRPIDQHIKAFETLGADIDTSKVLSKVMPKIFRAEIFSLTL